MAELPLAETISPFEIAPDELAEFDPVLLTEEEYGQVMEFDPDAFTQNGPALDDPHYQENLAERYDDNELGVIAQDVIEKFEQDDESRREWREREAEGLRLLGVIDDVGGGAPFDGASIVVHPALAEALVQFQAQSIQEFFPSEGPCKTVTAPGRVSPEVEAQARRVRDFINYQYTEMMPDAFEDDDQMMLRLPLSGSTFKKVYYDSLEQTVVSEFVEPTYFVAPYGARSLRKCERYTDVLWMNHSEVLQRQRIGEYLDTVDLPESFGQNDRVDNREIRDGIDESEGRHQQAPYEDDRREILQQHVMYRLPDEDDDAPKLPYIITVDKEMEKVLSIRRNWRVDDEDHRRMTHFVHYKFLPGYGFYGWGLLHIMGSLAMALTGNLRALLDSGGFANMQGGLSSGRIHLKGKDVAPAPGEWVKVDMGEEDIRKAFFPWPYREPSATLFQLLQHLDQLAQRIGNITNATTGRENPRNAPVGTVLALIEQANIRPTAVHKRLFNSRRKELRLVAELNAMYLPNRYPYMLPEGISAEIFAQDFDDRIDVLPIADPQIISGQQRIAQAQALVERAEAHPDIYDLRAAEERLLQALRIQQHETVLKPEQEQQPPPHQDPISENMALQTGEPVQAYPDQDHQAHIIVHSDWLERLEGQSDEVKMLEAAAFAHIAQHRAMLYQQQMMQAIGQPVPVGEQLPPDIENQIAAMAAQAAQLMPAPANPEAIKADRSESRKDAQIAAQERRKDEQALATERRKDAIAAAEARRKEGQAMAEVVRREAMTQSDIQRKKEHNINDMLNKVAQTEFDLTRKMTSEIARDTMSAEGATVNRDETLPL